MPMLWLETGAPLSGEDLGHGRPATFLAILRKGSSSWCYSYRYFVAKQHGKALGAFLITLRNGTREGLAWKERMYSWRERWMGISENCMAGCTASVG